MKQVSFENIGAVVATFAAGEGVAAGQVVQITGNGQVGPCEAGDAICGVALSDGPFVGVQVKGFAEVPVTGEVGLGWAMLEADGSGGVRTGETGREYLVAEVDSVAGKAVLCL